MSHQNLPEPWLRGLLPHLDPVVEHLLRASQQIREDLEAALAPLTGEQLWATPHGLNSAGFHARHLAGSTDRLSTYLEGRPLSPGQLAALAAESHPSGSAAELIAEVHKVFERYEELAQSLTPARFGEIREIGRQRLPTSAISLAIHIAEHGQRHVGQAISAAKLATRQ